LAIRALRLSAKAIEHGFRPDAALRGAQLEDNAAPMCATVGSGAIEVAGGIENQLAIGALSILTREPTLLTKIV
jgi:hypothetical protein